MIEKLEYECERCHSVIKRYSVFYVMKEIKSTLTYGWSWDIPDSSEQSIICSKCKTEYDNWWLKKK